MIIFLFIVLSYAAANLHLYYKIIAVLSPEFPVNFLLGLLLLIMAVSPTLIHIYSLRGSKRSVTFWSYLVFYWLSLLVIFFPLAFMLDVYNYFILNPEYAGHLFSGAQIISPENIFFYPLALAFFVNLYGYYEAKQIRVEHLTLKTDKLPAGTERIRIVQIADLHLGVIVGEKVLKKVIAMTEEAGPDLIVSTGDLLDGGVKHIGHMKSMLKNIKAPLGKFAVIGNHEFYGGLSSTSGYIEEVGFTLLRAEGQTIGNKLNIAGVDFIGGETASYHRRTDQATERDILSALPDSLYTVLLKHKTEVEGESLGLFDLQLSGHTHNGQIFPMQLAVMCIFRHHTGFKRLAKGSAIYVSRGTGTAGPPIRFLAPPEITIIDIERELLSIPPLCRKS
ncbi:MAG: metallophosphoesterase [Nitrospira sp.]|nr:metallophosphoesterase [bacterium]MBL7048395.1 metallophosphoesterase [Nitrospira sp.]